MLLNFIVRSRKDAAAVEAMVERFYPGWEAGVYTLKGARSAEAMLDAIQSIVERAPGFYVVLLGREDADKREFLESMLPPNVAVHVVPRARVRNARLEMLYYETVRARARLRLNLRWQDGVYVIGGSGEGLEGLEPEPSYEAFIGVGRFGRLVERLAGGRVGSNPLVVRASGGLHLVYNGPRVRARLYIEDRGFRPKAEIVGGEPVDLDLGRVVEANRGSIEAYVRASVEWLRSVGEGYDVVVVPWSGGKDSTAALLLAMEAFGKDSVRVVYGDTGTEFPASREYVERVARKLGIDYVVAYAGLDRELMKGAPLPSHDNRWCTGLKIEAIESAISDAAGGRRALVVVGDRDAESPRRSGRPPVREGTRRNLTVVAPLKPWGGVHVQLYILSRGLELNPMYGYGFYRIGCYMCPALRNWELYALTSNIDLYVKLSRNAIFRRFIQARLRGGASGGGDDCGCSI